MGSRLYGSSDVGVVGAAFSKGRSVGYLSPGSTVEGRLLNS